jgi:hypothetical protein
MESDIALSDLTAEGISSSQAGGPHGTNPTEELPDRLEFSLPQADGGKDAWLFLAACFVVEALVWGRYYLTCLLTLHVVTARTECSLPRSPGLRGGNITLCRFLFSL